MSMYVIQMLSNELHTQFQGKQTTDNGTTEECHVVPKIHYILSLAQISFSHEYRVCIQFYDRIFNLICLFWFQFCPDLQNSSRITGCDCECFRINEFSFFFQADPFVMG